jgi:hypothetical protein
MNPLSYRSTLLPFVLCMVVFFGLLVAVQRASGDAGPLDVASLDGGLEVAAAPPVDAGAPAKLDPTTLPDPVSDPAAALGELDQARKDGTIYVAIILALIMAGRAYVARATPGPDEPPLDPASWRAKSIAIAGAAIVVLAATVDKLAGVGTWTAVIVAAGLGVVAVIDAFNPPKGSKRPAEAGL